MKKWGKLYVAFVHLTKAFDLVKRPKLWDVLKRSGIKRKLYKVYKKCAKTVKVCVRTTEWLTACFNCPTGLQQWCIASPILFLMFINEFACIVENSSLKGLQLFPELTEILSLMFADGEIYKKVTEFAVRVLYWQKFNN